MRIFCTPLQPKVKVGPRWGFEPGDQDPRFCKHSNYAPRLVGTCDLCWKPAWWRWGREGRAWCLSDVRESLLSEGGHVESSVVLLPSLPSFLRKRRAPGSLWRHLPPPTATSRVSSQSPTLPVAFSPSQRTPGAPLSHCWAPMLCGEWPEETVLGWDVLWVRGTEIGTDGGLNARAEGG